MNKRIAAVTATACMLFASVMIPAVSAEGTTDIGAQNQVKAVAYNDALDKLDYKGIRVGGLSGLTWDKTADSYVAQSDNHGSDESRVWFLGKDLHNPLLDNFEDLVITHADDNGRLDLSLLTDNNFDTTETTRIVNVQIDRSVFVADPSNGDGQQHGATIQRPSGAGLGGSTVRLAHTGAAVTAVFMLAAVTLTSGLVLIAGRRLRISRE